jgi:phage terminase large subunit
MSEARQIIYHEKQLKALELLSIENPTSQILYGGGVFSGKSFLGCDWQIKRRLKYAGTKGLIGRAELKKLRLSTMQTFFELCSFYGLKPNVHYTYNGQDHVIKWYNGSQTILMDLADMPSDPDFQRFGSIEITDYFVDEVAEVSKRCVDILESRVRYKLINDKAKGLMTCNPSKGWLYNEFYLKYKNNELPVHRAFVQALPTDNPHISETYLENLRRLPEYDRKRLLEGNWEFDDDSDKLFATDNLLRMFRNELLDGTKYITSDIARFGKDRTIICVWNGLTLIELKMLHKASIDEVVNEIRNTAKNHNVLLQNVVCDEDGVGGGVVDYLKCRGFVNGSKAKQPQYQNLKSECYYTLAQYIEENKLTILVNDKKEQIVRELEMIKRHRADVDGKLQVTPKDQIKLREGISPDIADAIMMRMFFELHKSYGQYFVG